MPTPKMSEAQSLAWTAGIGVVPIPETTMPLAAFFLKGPHTQWGTPDRPRYRYDMPGEAILFPEYDMAVKGFFAKGAHIHDVSYLGILASHTGVPLVANGSPISPGDIIDHHIHHYRCRPASGHEHIVANDTPKSVIQKSHVWTNHTLAFLDGMGFHDAISQRMTRFYMDTYPRDNARTKDIVSLSMRSAMLDVRAHRPMSADTFFAHCDHFIKLHPDTSPDVIKRMMAHGLSEAIVFAPEATKDHVCSYLGSSSSDEQLLAAQLLVWMEPLERALAIPWTDSWDHVLSHAGDEPVVRQVVLSRCVDVMVQRWYRSPDPYIRASLLDAASDYASEMSPLSMERVHPLAYVSMALTHDGERDAASRWFASCIHSHVQSTSSQASAFKAGVSGVIKHGMHGDIGLYMDGRCGEQWSIYAKSEGIDIPWFGSREAFTYRRDRVMGPLPFKDMESLVKDMYKKLDADPLVAPL